MQCPRDGATLVSGNYEGDVVVDRCPTCNGIWLDSGELRTIQESTERDYSEELGRIDVVGRAYEFARQETLPEIDCPKCGGEMNPREYAYCSQILIDRCAKCGGVWLDAGELATLEKFFEEAAAEELAEKNVRKGFFGSLMQHLH